MTRLCSQCYWLCWSKMAGTPATSASWAQLFTGQEINMASAGCLHMAQCRRSSCQFLIRQQKKKKKKKKRKPQCTPHRNIVLVVFCQHSQSSDVVHRVRPVQTSQKHLTADLQPLCRQRVSAGGWFSTVSQLVSAKCCTALWTEWFTEGALCVKRTESRS